MYLWRTSASRIWLSDNESRLRALAGDRLAIVERPNRKRLQLEVASGSSAKLQKLVGKFGGRVEKLPKDWLKRSLRVKTQPINVGTGQLIIPAGVAFGTGEHATTAMCLRMLEKLTRKWKHDWSSIDLGTGSGILALAAGLLGASRVIGFDNDPIAIRTAKHNARLNKLVRVQFRRGDVRRWRFPQRVDVVVANLFSELLIEILPRLKGVQWLILSGILRGQERDVRRGLKRNKINIVRVKRRGKWVAILAASR